MEKTFRNGEFPIYTGRTVLGALAGCIFSLYFSKKYFGFSYRIFDLIAPVIPLSMAIQRIGCFLSGCCFGTVTNVPWAIQYGYNTPTHIHHSNEGIISMHDVASLPVHPNQLYQSLACIIIFLVTVFYLRKHIRRAGNVLLTTITLYLVSRFFTEFLREDVTNGVAGEMWMGLKWVQWSLILSIGFLAFVIFKREKSENEDASIFPVFPDTYKKPILLYYIILITLLFFWNGLPTTEKLVLASVILISFIFYLRNFPDFLSKTDFRWTVLTFFPILLVFHSFHTNDPEKTNSNKNYFSVGTGGYIGDYSSYSESRSFCGTSISRYNSEYHIYGLGIAYTVFDKDDNKWVISGNFARGKQSEYNPSRGIITNYDLYGGTLIMKYESKNIGYTLGGLYGNFVWKLNTIKFLPVLDFRYGNVKKFYGAIGFGNQFPGYSGLENFYLETGTSLAKQKAEVKFGYTFAGFYLRSKFDLFKTKLTAEPYLYLGNINSTLYKGSNNYRFGLSFWWNFK